MYLHKENRELFRDAILLASEKMGVSEDIVEKDYYVTLILKKLWVNHFFCVIAQAPILSRQTSDEAPAATLTVCLLFAGL